ncbi:hypothetical protein QTH90_27980 [Variovorax sp. J2P1-59]|nr:hypothetical protein [Variovorax sp. J2P1-59]MDM0078274.1 hypothetical protein [Variovorax sp. J2P1-59]
MPRILSTSPIHPFRGVGSALLWGAIELVALARSRWASRSHPGR